MSRSSQARLTLSAAQGVGVCHVFPPRAVSSFCISHVVVCPSEGLRRAPSPGFAISFLKIISKVYYLCLHQLSSGSFLPVCLPTCACPQQITYFHIVIEHPGQKLSYLLIGGGFCRFILGFWGAQCCHIVTILPPALQLPDLKFFLSYNWMGKHLQLLAVVTSGNLVPFLMRGLLGASSVGGPVPAPRPESARFSVKNVCGEDAVICPPYVTEVRNFVNVFRSIGSRRPALHCWVLSTTLFLFMMLAQQCINTVSCFSGISQLPSRGRSHFTGRTNFSLLPGDLSWP